MISSTGVVVDKILLGNWSIDVQDEKLMFSHTGGETVGFVTDNVVEEKSTLLSGTCVVNSLHLDNLNLSNWKMYNSDDKLVFDYNNVKEFEIVK